MAKRYQKDSGGALFLAGDFGYQRSLQLKGLFLLPIPVVWKEKRVAIATLFVVTTVVRTRRQLSKDYEA